MAHVAGVESDMELAFAGLQQLCAPLLDHLDELPEPQREALTVAFGRGVGPTPDRFLVGLAVLSLMAAVATDQPLLVRGRRRAVARPGVGADAWLRRASPDGRTRRLVCSVREAERAVDTRS